MGTINIQDTGYIKPTNAGTQANSALMVNGGTVISLKTAEFTPSVKRNFDNTPEIGLNVPSEINLGSLENMRFSLTCKLNLNNATDMAQIQHLLKLVQTDGYKLLWYNYTDSVVEDNNGQLIYQLALNSTYGHALTNGEKTAFNISDNFYHLHVHIFDIQPRHSAKSGYITYTMTGVVLKVEPSSI